MYCGFWICAIKLSIHTERYVITHIYTDTHRAVPTVALSHKTGYKTKQMNVNANTNFMHVILFLSRLNSMTNLIFVSPSERRFSLLFYLIGP